MILAKASVCLQCVRFFSVGRDKAFWTVHIFLFINILYFGAVWVASGLECVPRAKIWNPALPGKCINYTAYDLVTGVFNLVSDVLMFLYPLVRVWKLQMSHTRKRAVSGIFLIALL